MLRGLERFAERRGGQVVWDSESTVFPKVAVEDGPVRLRLSVQPSLRKADRCDVQLALRSTRIVEPHYFPVVEVFSTGLLRELFRAPWMERGAVVDRAFDERFRIRFMPPLRLNVFLAGKERDLLFRLLYLFGRNNLYMASDFDKVVLRKTLHVEELSQPGWTDELWRPASVLFRRLEQKVTEAVLGEEEMRLVAIRHDMLARCKVCGEAILFDEVRCVDCDTPHHRDCWAYGGGCSVYGCGSRSHRVRLALPGPSRGKENG